MPEYRVLRTCYWGRRVYQAGTIHVFPKGAELPHHFEPLNKGRDATPPNNRDYKTWTMAQLLQQVADCEVTMKQKGVVVQGRAREDLIAALESLDRRMKTSTQNTGDGEGEGKS